MKFIFRIRVKHGHTVDEYVEAWEQASAVIQKMQGARGTYLHREIGNPTVLLAIAEWDSRQASVWAIASLRRDPATRETIDRHLAHGEFSLVGEFEDPEWCVVQ